MRVYDQVAAVVKSGGKTRRAAKMQSIKVWHPDVMEFIECKWKEEKKARVLIEKGGYESNFNGEAYSSIMFQNANLSVRVTDDFMQAVEKNEDWTTHWVTNPKQPGPTYPAREIMDRMADCAWHCGDPGVQYDTTINNWHTCPNSGRINASESVQRVHVPRRHGLQPGQHQPDEVPQGRRHVRRRSLPGGLPHLLHRPGNPGRPRQLPDARHRPEQPPVPAARPRLLEPRQPADDGRHAVRFATKAAASAARSPPCCTVPPTSPAAELAEAVGPFDEYEKNREPMLRVMQMHRDAVEEIDPECPPYMQDAARTRVGRSAGRRRASTASATRRPRCSPRPARSAS